MIRSYHEDRTVTFTGERLGERVTVQTLIEALENALVWLRGRDPDSTVDWEVVKVAIGKSLRLTLSSHVANGHISDRMKNLRSLQKKRIPKMPPRLTDEDIEGTRGFASMIGGQIKSMKISSPGAPTVKLTPTLIQHVESISESTRSGFHEWDAVRGTVDQITVSSVSCRFRLKHQLTGDSISCTAPLRELEEIKQALPHRIEVYGRVKYNRSDKPKSIDVQRIRLLPESDIPFDSISPINITSGMASEVYVERLRGAQ